MTARLNQGSNESVIHKSSTPDSDVQEIGQPPASLSTQETSIEYF